MSLSVSETRTVRDALGRKPTADELHMIAAQWSEHCSYKSSKVHLGMLPTSGKRVISEVGYDSGVLDVGDGYVITIHIESHNHPSAVEPYGGAATGVGGIIRDILSAGTRPIAILDGLRFGDITRDSGARWLFRNAVRGIADYGNCIGIPTVAGETEFDPSYNGYALVDVAAVGFGRREKLIKNRAAPGDILVLIGGPTGRDGVGGSQFASDSLESEDRSAVQIPDPFMEKMVIEAVLKARDEGLIHALKDLGGGGLSCAVSETADTLGIGVELYLDAVHTREELSPAEILTSESQERMLMIVPAESVGRLCKICDTYGVRLSEIGRVTKGVDLHVQKGGETVAHLSAGLVANAPLLNRASRRPEYLDSLPKENPRLDGDISDELMMMLSRPNIASKHWIYGQYDHEVGIRTVLKPGGDAASLRLDNGKYLAIKIDGNPRHCYLDARNGAIGCFEEACRNVVCTGASPIGMIDHMQFGDPSDPGIFWTFLESLRGISEFAGYLDVPCVGGKVSFYNETPRGPIKPTPVIGVVGISDMPPPRAMVSDSDLIMVVGRTRDELGGSEYLEGMHGFVGGRAPVVDFAESRRNMDAVLDAVSHGMARAVTDCSKGGLGAALSRLCIMHGRGCRLDIENIPLDVSSMRDALFSESHSRYLLAVAPENRGNMISLLGSHGAAFGEAGRFGGSNITFCRDKETVSLDIDAAGARWRGGLEEALCHG